MKLLIILLFFSVYALSTLAKGDGDEPEIVKHKYGIAILPQYAIASTMRLDFDIALKNTNVLTLSPMFSFARNSSLLFPNNSNSYYDSEYEENYPQNIALTGVGFKALYRHFFNAFENNGAYAGLGMHYRFSHVEYEDRGWASSTLDGIPAIRYGFRDQEENIHQGGLDILFGYQLYLVDNLFLDLYGGWGFRLSDLDSDEDEDNYWGETIFDIGYSGYTPLLGMRLGLYF